MDRDYRIDGRDLKCGRYSSLVDSDHRVGVGIFGL
jgi:hypothetical protein